jgi:hypothetical protein
MDPGASSMTKRVLPSGKVTLGTNMMLLLDNGERIEKNDIYAFPPIKGMTTTDRVGLVTEIYMIWDPEDDTRMFVVRLKDDEGRVWNFRYPCLSL